MRPQPSPSSGGGGEDYCRRGRARMRRSQSRGLCRQRRRRAAYGLGLGAGYGISYFSAPGIASRYLVISDRRRTTLSAHHWQGLSAQHVIRASRALMRLDGSGSRRRATGFAAAASLAASACSATRGSAPIGCGLRLLVRGPKWGGRRSSESSGVIPKTAMCDGETKDEEDVNDVDATCSRRELRAGELKACTLTDARREFP